MRKLALFTALLAACEGGAPATSGSDLGDYLRCGACGSDCSATNAADCDARDSCHSVFSGDLPCNDGSCQNHFVRCEAGPATCASAGVCKAACTTQQPSCPGGMVALYPSADQTCCAIGCVAPDRCSLPPSCSLDSDCGSNAYCRGALAVCKSMCQLTIGTTATGICHRVCNGVSCACADDADCPGRFTHCDLPSGECITEQPPVCNAGCPSGCYDTTNQQYGEICICGGCS